MKQSEVVEILSKQVGSCLKDLSDNEILILKLIGLMPYYVKISRLELWESSIHEVLYCENPSNNQKLIEGLFDFACTNLYSGFEAEESNKELKSFVRILKNNGINGNQYQYMKIEEW